MPPALPESPAAVTASWLTEVLNRSFPSVEVVGVETLAQHSGTTGRLRLGLSYAPGAEGPESVFVKLPPFDDSQRKLVAATDMGRREARFYEGPAFEAPLRIPVAYFAAHGDDPAEYVMVLEDLEASGCRFATRLEPFDGDHGGQLIESLARLHARFWNDPRFDDELSWVRPAMRGSYGARLVASAREQFADQFPPAFTDLCLLYEEHHERINELLDDGEQTLIHGDTHAGNQFMDGDQVGLYDWAVISRSPGIRDVAIYLGNSCPTEVRRERQDRWLRRYHEVLVESGVDAPSFEMLWLRFRRTVLYAWIAATTTAAMGSKWQPIEVGMVGMKRATDTCADVDTVEALREAR
ncbi:MAG TPA: phosphotransferase [Microthrixaceae bacterium]|nr:phosphotransferase [Microthrixaceae bacterium]